MGITARGPHRGLLDSPRDDSLAKISFAGIPPNRPSGKVTTEPSWSIWKNKKSAYEAQKAVEYGNLIADGEGEMGLLYFVVVFSFFVIVSALLSVF